MIARVRAVVLGAAVLLAIASCGTYARSDRPETTRATWGSLPPLEALGLRTTTTQAGQPAQAATTAPARPASTGPAPTSGRGGPQGGGAPVGSMSAIDAMPCAHPVDHHAVDRTDSAGLFLRIGVAKNCVGAKDKIEVVVQIGNPGTTKLYVSSASRVLVSLVGAGGKAAWSSPCELKPPPPGGPPDVPIAIDPGSSVQVADVFYEPGNSQCGVLGVGRYDGQGSVAQCSQADGTKGVCNNPTRVPTERIGVEVRA